MFCSHCDEIIDKEEIEFAKKRKFKGFFCEACEFFYSFEASFQRPQYRLYLEKSSGRNDEKILNKPSVKLSKRISPLRYPGGKTRLIDFVYEELKPFRSSILYSPFAGGASLELAMLDAGVVSHVVLNDLDAHLMNFYQVAFYHSESLIGLIASQPLTIDLYKKAHDLVIEPYSDDGTPSVEKAFFYLVNNRCSFSGIYKAGRMGGKNGGLESLGSRWNPSDLSRRIQKLSELSNRITLSKLSYHDFIEKHAWETDGIFIIDPPYVEKADAIYRHSFKRSDHYNLFSQLESFWRSHPSCHFFVFYDDHPYLYGLPIPEDIHVLARKFSISNASSKASKAR